MSEQAPSVARGSIPASPIVSPFSSQVDTAALSRQDPVICGLVDSAEELDLHLRVREEVFVREQRLFQGTDRDSHDDNPSTLHVLGLCNRVLGGVVRLYPLDEPGLWKGDRLAVTGDAEVGARWSTDGESRSASPIGAVLDQIADADPVAASDEDD